MHHSPSPDDICLWPCGTWCHAHELPEYSHMSDDYQRVSIHDANPLFEGGELRSFCPLDDCPPPAVNTAASLQAPAAGQGEGIHDLECWECDWSGVDDGFMARCPVCDCLSLSFIRGPL